MTRSRRAPATRRWLGLSAAQIGSGSALLIAVASLIFAAMSYFQDRQGQQMATESRVRILSTRPDVKKNIPLSLPDTEGGPAAIGSADGAALDIVLQNDFEQGALINRDDLTVVDAIELASCQGAG